MYFENKINAFVRINRQGYNNVTIKYVSRAAAMLNTRRVIRVIPSKRKQKFRSSWSPLAAVLICLQ